MQAFVDGNYPVGDAESWANHMSNQEFVMSLLKIISAAYYSQDKDICELLDTIETHIEKVIV